MRPSRAACLSAAILFAAVAPLSAGEVPSFRNEVMAVLSRAGCNQGTCHGNQNGKGGFRLTLRGEDWRKDYDTLTRQDGGRRLNRLDAAASLLLAKPAMAVPHEGGRRLDRHGREYAIVRDWIAAGAPQDRDDAPRAVSLAVTPTERTLYAPETSLSIKVEAAFSDGSTRDVTSLAVFEPSSLLVKVADGGQVTATGPGEVTVTARYLHLQTPVRLAFVPERPDFVASAPAPANYVDELVFAKLERLRVNPAPPCDDATFARRAHLDLLGRLPTGDEARAFVVDAAPDKRRRLVDELLARPEFAGFWALKWADLLRAEEKTLDERGVTTYVGWIRESVAANKPLDAFARELVAARGSTYDVPPANFYRAMRDPITRSESVAQIFLGVRLQCAKCHNHPFDHWTQADYYGWANLFTPVDYEIKANERKDKNDKHEFVGEQVVKIDPAAKPVPHPDTGEAIPPRFLAGDGAGPTADGDRLEQLAAWMTTDNPQFARATANRIWADLLGRGIVDPVDDFRATNPPANPELLDALAADLAGHGYDLRHLVRTVMASNVYQLSAETNPTNADDETNFSRAYPRRLAAEQLVDAVSQVVGTPVKFGGYDLGTRAVEIPGVRGVQSRRGPQEAGDRFLKLFGKPPRLQPCACERSNESTLAQTFTLVSGELIADLLADEQNRLAGLTSSDRTPEQMVEELYWAALTRGPTPEETAAAVEHLAKADDRRAALEDVTWALLNSDEFLLRR